MNSVKWTKRFSDTLEKAKGSFVVYWISSSLHKDVKTEGYVGVSSNLYDRVGSHISKCKKKKSKLYPQEMIASLNSEEFNLTILCQGSEDYCYTKELELRSERNTGWNKRSGGKHFRDHIDHNVYKTFTGIVSKAKKLGLQISTEWSGFDGPNNFNDFYKNEVEGVGLRIYLPKAGLVGKDTVTLQKQEFFIADIHKKLDFFCDGNLISNTEVANLLGIKPNTLATQRKRGWSNGKIFIRAWNKPQEF